MSLSSFATTDTTFCITEGSSGCDTVGRLVVSKLRGPRFEYKSLAMLSNINRVSNVYRIQKKINEKRPVMAYFGVKSDRKC